MRFMNNAHHGKRLISTTETGLDPSIGCFHERKRFGYWIEFLLVFNLDISTDVKN